MNIGLYLSESNGEVSRVFDVSGLAGEYMDLSVVRVFDNFFPARSINAIKADIADNNLDAVVLAGESPLYFQNNREASSIIKEIEKSGINLNRISFANIKEHAALPHKTNPQGACRKAKLLIDVAIEKVKTSPPFEIIEFPPKKRVAVIGASLEGIVIAERLLAHGYKVYLIDKDGKVRMPEEEKAFMRTSVGYVLGHENLQVFSETTVKEVIGRRGDFTVTLEKNGTTQSLPVGAVMAATGSDLEYTDELRSVLYLAVDKDGYFKPLNRHTMATATRRSGMFIVPPADSICAKVSYAESAAMGIIALLDKEELLYEVPVSQVDERLCGGCGTCIKTCMFKASSIDEAKRIAIVDAMRCRGCGNCVTSCPTGARDLLANPTKYLHSAIEILAQLPSNGDPKVLYMLCEGCGYPSLDIAGESDTEYSVNIMPLGVKCGARVDTQLILEAFAKGFDGVIIGKCKEDKCQNLVGSVDLDRRANLFREILRSRGIDSERLRIVAMDGCEDATAAEVAETFLNELKTMEVTV